MVAISPFHLQLTAEIFKKRCCLSLCLSICPSTTNLSIHASIRTSIQPLTQLEYLPQCFQYSVYSYQFQFHVSLLPCRFRSISCYFPAVSSNCMYLSLLDNCLATTWQQKTDVPQITLSEDSDLLLTRNYNVVR